MLVCASVCRSIFRGLTYKIVGIKSTHNLTDPYPGQLVPTMETLTRNQSLGYELTHAFHGERSTRNLGQFLTISSTKYYSVFFHIIWQNRLTPYPNLELSLLFYSMNRSTNNKSLTINKRVHVKYSFLHK